MDSDLVSALRARDVAVLTVLDTGLTSRADEEQLAFAAENGCALYTFNIRDFHRIHVDWAAGGREHAGLVLALQQRISIGEQLRRILRLRAALSREAMRNRAEFLSNWA